MAEIEKAAEFFLENGEDEEDVEEGSESEESEGVTCPDNEDGGRGISPSSSFISQQWPQSYKYVSVYTDKSCRVKV